MQNTALNNVAVGNMLPDFLMRLNSRFSLGLDLDLFNLDLDLWKWNEIKINVESSSSSLGLRRFYFITW